MPDPWIGAHLRPRIDPGQDRVHDDGAYDSRSVIPRSGVCDHPPDIEANDDDRPSAQAFSGAEHDIG
jgi:hypothetical protein